MKLGFHASHELYPPGDLLGHVRMAERAGFAAAMCSDHFHPWTERQGESGFAWAWLGAAMQATRPAVRGRQRARASAITRRSSPRPPPRWPRCSPAGSGSRWGPGQNLNEHITGDPWPAKPDRQARLREAVDVIRALWAGETVDHDGPLVPRPRRQALHAARDPAADLRRGDHGRDRRVGRRRGPTA